MCFSKIKRFLERFEATTYILLSVKSFKEVMAHSIYAPSKI